MPLGELKIAVVHDELTRRGGAEIVLEEILRLFPQADVFALYAGQPFFTLDDRHYDIHTSFLQKLPAWFRRHPRRLLPLLPQASEQLDLSAYDVVISSASAFAKGVITRANVLHICYCHTPTRYLWENAHLKKWPGRLLLHYLRMADFNAAQRVDTYIANSQYTQERISTYYRRNSTVIYPPIETSFFTPGPNENTRRHFLVVGRLTPSKLIDQAIQACEKLRVPLVIVGKGHDLPRLRRSAGPHTTFVGSVPAQELRNYYRSARALLQPGVEDFGMASAEAQACGTPVIAYNAGGVREIVKPMASGLLYSSQRVETLAEAMRRFIQLEDSFLPEVIQQSALRFNKNRFREQFLALLKAESNAKALARPE